ncbi:MAG: asparagine synthase C-terminal domain-containing protein [Candidatus Nitrosotenuis sp.]|uniref:Asparagine synthase n=1 Tax=Candidatus Nitrosotenuis uzonensis TaxID=1407055 RepID=A0A812F1Y1_9ARCH|nr:asparagine synthase C-terminal domain-containing protein [Candidatus Nitrosotenuis uzonensis]MCA2003479.1 asparagine synthase C-terminal domain-containing protein [Candidatus Nitrosotenuis sp.]CAE6495170.1 Asparagine synthase [Candidatus Nitrosotenuis uzonensis]
MQDQLLEKIKNAILNMVKEKKIGIAFSGGVDSTLVAKVCHDTGYDITLLTVGFAGSHDIEFSKKINKFLQFKHHVLEINPREFTRISKQIRARIKTDNLSWNENCIAFYHVAKLARNLGIDTVVTANGIDELFCGYNGYRQAIKEGPQKIMDLMASKLENEIAMMKAVNDVSGEFEVIIVQPLLSDEFIKYAKSIPLSYKITDENDLLRKHIVRKAAILAGVPESSANARKKALQYGSLIHKTLIRSR